MKEERNTENSRRELRYMKLELKHIAPYIPYGVEGLFTLSSVANIPKHKDEERIKLLTEDNIAFFRRFCKLILRPLSDIHKEIVHNGKKVYPWREVNKLLNGEYNADYNNIEVNEYGGLRINFGDQSSGYDLRESYEVVQLLLEWHFDINGLTEKGLAIDINELNRL